MISQSRVYGKKDKNFDESTLSNRRGVRYPEIRGQNSVYGYKCRGTSAKEPVWHHSFHVSCAHVATQEKPLNSAWSRVVNWPCTGVRVGCSFVNSSSKLLVSALPFYQSSH